MSEHKWEFDITDRNFRLRASYSELGDNVIITRNDRPFKTLTYPGYRI